MGERMRILWLRCRRTGQVRSVEEHVVCPYCLGDAGPIERGEPYEAFCTFDAARDPIHFGFPEDTTRYRRA